MTDDLELTQSDIRFDIYTRRWNPEIEDFEPSGLTASLGADEKMRLHGIASSTIRDLHGDTMTTSALEDMERAANAGLTIFGNHKYEVPEDIYGTVESAKIKQAGTVDKNGDPIYDLAFDVIVNDENDRAIKTFKAIQKKSKLGMSIGAMIPEGGAVRDRKTGKLTINHVELLETSIVGIPANPRSWVENAVKSFTKAQSGTITSEPYEITSTIITTIEETSPDITEGACPTCGKAQNDSCSDSYHNHKDIEPDVTDAKITLVEIDTGDDHSQQDAPQSEPSSEGSSTSETVLEEEAAAADVVASAEDVIGSNESLEPDVVAVFSQLVDSNKLLIRELELAKAAEREALDAKVSAEADRDSLATMTIQIVGGTKAILDKLADQPVGRRAVFHEAETEFSALEGIYSRDFLNLLRSKNT